MFDPSQVSLSHLEQLKASILRPTSHKEEESYALWQLTLTLDEQKSLAHAWTSPNCKVSIESDGCMVNVIRRWNTGPETVSSFPNYMISTDGALSFYDHFPELAQGDMKVLQRKTLEAALRYLENNDVTLPVALCVGIVSYMIDCRNNYVAASMHKARVGEPEVIVKFKKLHPDAIIPKRATPQAAGMDLFAYEDVALAFGEVCNIPTGIAVSIPPGYELQCRPRSGLAAHNGVTIVNSPGTIDSDYRGEIKVIATLAKNAHPYISISKGDRIAQLVLCKLPPCSIIEVTELDETERGVNGLGSTGK